MKFIFLLFLFFALNTNAQTTSACNCKGFIDTDYEGSISLFDKPGGMTIKLLRNDVKNEDYLLFVIDNAADSFFHVTIKNNSSETAYKGWIHKSKRLVTQIRNYDKRISLYTEASSSSPVSRVIPKNASTTFQITGCKMNWIYLAEYTKALNKPQGWLESKNQCANPYTTCN